MMIDTDGALMIIPTSDLGLSERVSMFEYVRIWGWIPINNISSSGVTTISRPLKIICLFCKRAL